MSVESTSNHSLELEIHSQLTSQSDVQLLIDQLENFTDWNSLSFQDLCSLCQVYIKSGYAGQLVQTLGLRIDQLPKFPWAHFALALEKAIKPAKMTTDLASLIIMSSKLDQATLELMRADFILDFDSELAEARLQLSNARAEFYSSKYEDLKSQAELMRSQGLNEEEEKIIQKWLKYFPEDDQALEALLAVRERRFAEAAQKPENQTPIPKEKKSPVEIRLLEIIERSQKQILESNPDLAKDFSLAHVFWGQSRSSSSFPRIHAGPLVGL